MKRIKYNRARLESAIAAAQKIGETRFIFATAFGWTIDTRPVPWQGYYQVDQGEVTRHEAGQSP